MLNHNPAMASRRRFLGGAAAALPILGIGPMARQVIAQPSPQTLQPLPDVADNSASFPPVKDQGDRNTCAAFVVAALAEAAIFRDSGRRVVLSEEYLIHHALSRREVPDGEPYGEVMSYTSPIAAAQLHGFALEQDWPYRPQLMANGKPCTAPGQAGVECPEEADAPALPGPALPGPALPGPSCERPPAPPAWVVEKAAALKVDGWAFGGNYVTGWNTPKLAQSRIDAARRLIAVNKGGVIIAVKQVNCNEGWGDDGLVTVPQSLRGMPAAMLEEMPNHFVVLTGYDNARREFTFRNCWGKSWGREGYGTISFETFGAPTVGENIVWIRRPKAG